MVFIKLSLFYFVLYHFQWYRQSDCAVLSVLDSDASSSSAIMFIFEFGLISLLNNNCIISNVSILTEKEEGIMVQFSVYRDTSF